MRYWDNLDLFHNLNIFANYSEINATEWVWPNYIPSIRTWKPQLPKFLLNANYEINIGSNIDNKIHFVPFNQCQNAKFILRVCTNNPLVDTFWTTPTWISVDQRSSSVQIDTYLVTSVEKYNLTFQSQLIVDPSLFTESHQYTSTQFSLISFENENWKLDSDVSNWYVILGVTKTYSVNFSDAEKDKINIKLVETGNFDVFVQNVNQTTFNFIMN